MGNLRTFSKASAGGGRVDRGRYAPSKMKTIMRMLVLTGAAYTLATKSGRARLKRARETYTREVNSGSRPIEAVGTAVAAFVGRAPDDPAR